MKAIILVAAAALLAGPVVARAAPTPGPVEDTEGPLRCMLHFSTALPEATRFTPDGSTHLVWEDSLGRRTEAELRSGGDVVLRLPGGLVQHVPASKRLPTEGELELTRRMVSMFRERGVDLPGRRFLASGGPFEPPPDPEDQPVWSNAEGIWTLGDVCANAERLARANCTWECSQDGMTGFYTPGECGVGSSCWCGYEVHTRPF